MTQLPVKRVTKAILRQEFNQRQFYQKMLSGELIAFVKRNNHCSPPPIGEPDCTHTQTVLYYNLDNELVAIVHQYRRPDGTLGASGLPDPKKLVLEDCILALPSPKK
jgi:hypothetical protein